MVIVNWNARDALVDCLLSIAAHPPAAAVEVILVDNASVDGSLDAARAVMPALKVVANRDNVGLARGNNQGIDAANGRALLICNPDVVFTEGAIDALLATMRRRPRAAFVVARLVNPDGTGQTSAGDLPRLAQALLGRRAGMVFGSGRGPGEGAMWWHSWAHDEERRIGHGAEAAYLVRAEALAEIGLQDEHFPLDWEGIDWSRRAGAADWETWFCPAAMVVHVGGTSIRGRRVGWVFDSHRGMYRYYRKDTPAAARPLLAAAVSLRALAKVAAMAAGDRVYRQANRGGSGVKTARPRKG